MDLHICQQPAAPPWVAGISVGPIKIPIALKNNVIVILSRDPFTFLGYLTIVYWAEYYCWLSSGGCAKDLLSDYYFCRGPIHPNVFSDPVSPRPPASLLTSDHSCSPFTITNPGTTCTPLTKHHQMQRVIRTLLTEVRY